MSERLIIFDANSLLKLLTHYTQDSNPQIPLDAELRFAGVSKYIGRWVVLDVEAKEWDGELPDPLTGELPFIHVRYEGNKVFSWRQDNSADLNDRWKPTVESPA